MILRRSAGVLSNSQYICPSCVRRLRPTSVTVQKRAISQSHIQKTMEAELAWATQATEIKAGRQESMLAMLEKRGYINQIVGDRDELDQLMTEKRVGMYVGIDPTAASMHIGHLLPLMVLYWAYIKGFHACSLLGGATAQIGDPIGRTATREIQHSTERKVNMTKMHLQLKSMWLHVETRAQDYGYLWKWPWRREVTNNNSWLNKVPMLEVLKMLGRGVRLGTMLGRDTVKDRMKHGAGMSFAEFTYPLLQSWDWWYMYDTKDIQVQVGGSDQFGNVLAGIDAINYIRRTHHDPDKRQKDDEEMEENAALLKKPMGFTVPLLTTSSGEKFGKSAGNAIWLDREMTSAFDLYQFFLRMADSDVHRYLKLFTFEPLDVLEKIMEEHYKEPSKRVAQHKLARDVLVIVHGPKVAEETEEQHRSLFRGSSIAKPQVLVEADGTMPPNSSRHLDMKAPIVNADNAPFYSLTLPRSLVYNQAFARILYHAGLAASRSEGHRLIAKKGVYIGSRPSSSGTMGDQVDFSPAATNWKGSETQKYIIGKSTLIVRVGKWKVKIIKIVSDEDFDAQGLTAPGWEEWKLGKQDEPIATGVSKMKPWHGRKYAAKALLHQKGAEHEAWDRPSGSSLS